LQELTHEEMAYGYVKKKATAHAVDRSLLKKVRELQISGLGNHQPSNRAIFTCGTSLI
jgi:hypothetical protein